MLKYLTMGISQEEKFQLDHTNITKTLGIKPPLFLPVVWQLQLQSCMVSSLNNDDVRAEVWAEQQTQGFDNIGFLGFSSWQTQLSELFIWTQHHQLRTKHNSTRTVVKIQKKKQNIFFASMGGVSLRKQTDFPPLAFQRRKATAGKSVCFRRLGRCIR